MAMARARAPPRFDHQHHRSRNMMAAKSQGERSGLQNTFHFASSSSDSSFNGEIQFLRGRIRAERLLASITTTTALATSASAASVLVLALLLVIWWKRKSSGIGAVKNDTPLQIQTTMSPNDEHASVSSENSNDLGVMDPDYDELEEENCSADGMANRCWRPNKLCLAYKKKRLRASACHVVHNEHPPKRQRNEHCRYTTLLQSERDTAISAPCWRSMPIMRKKNDGHGLLAKARTLCPSSQRKDHTFGVVEVSEDRHATENSFSKLATQPEKFGTPGSDGITRSSHWAQNRKAFALVMEAQNYQESHA